jgi:hypothetical protein
MKKGQPTWGPRINRGTKDVDGTVVQGKRPSMMCMKCQGPCTPTTVNGKEAAVCPKCGATYSASTLSAQAGTVPVRVGVPRPKQIPNPFRR